MFRELVNFRTTLGHKVNHKFSQEANGNFEVVKHPLFGVIAAVIAEEVIEEDEEIFVDYNYYSEDSPLEDLLDCPDWYQKAYKEFEEKFKQ